VWEGPLSRRADSGSNPSLLTLLCLSRTHGRIHRPGELPVELAGDVPLEAAADFPGGFSLGGAAGDIGASPGTAAHQRRVRGARWVGGHHAPCSPGGRRQGIRTLTGPLPAAGAVSLPDTLSFAPRQQKTAQHPDHPGVTT